MMNTNTASAAPPATAPLLRPILGYSETDTEATAPLLRPVIGDPHDIENLRPEFDAILELLSYIYPIHQSVDKSKSLNKGIILRLIAAIQHLQKSEYIKNSTIPFFGNTYSLGERTDTVGSTVAPSEYARLAKFLANKPLPILLSELLESLHQIYVKYGARWDIPVKEVEVEVDTISKIHDALHAYNQNLSSVIESGRRNIDKGGEQGVPKDIMNVLKNIQTLVNALSDGGDDTELSEEDIGPLVNDSNELNRLLMLDGIRLQPPGEKLMKPLRDTRILLTNIQQQDREAALLTLKYMKDSIRKIMDENTTAEPASNPHS